LAKGVGIKSGGTLTVAVPIKRPELPSAIDKAAMDNAILQTAFEVREQDGGRPTVFVTMDTNLRIRADALGMVAETYEDQRDEPHRLDTAVTELEGSADDIDACVQEGHIPPPAQEKTDKDRERETGERGRNGSSTNGLLANICVLLRDRANPSHTALGRYDAAKKEIVGLRTPRE